MHTSIPRLCRGNIHYLFLFLYTWENLLLWMSVYHKAIPHSEGILYMTRYNEEILIDWFDGTFFFFFFYRRSGPVYSIRYSVRFSSASVVSKINDWLNLTSDRTELPAAVNTDFHLGQINPPHTDTHTLVTPHAAWRGTHAARTGTRQAHARTHTDIKSHTHTHTHTRAHTMPVLSENFVSLKQHFKLLTVCQRYYIYVHMCDCVRFTLFRQSRRKFVGLW